MEVEGGGGGGGGSAKPSLFISPFLAFKSIYLFLVTSMDRVREKAGLCRLLREGAKGFDDAEIL